MRRLRHHHHNAEGNSSYPTPKDIVLSVMTFVKKESKLTTDKATGNEVSKVFLHYRSLNLDVPNPSLHSAIKLDSMTHFQTFNHVMAEVKHFRSKILS